MNFGMMKDHAEATERANRDHDAERAAYDAFFASWTSDPAVSRWLQQTGGITPGLHNMLYTFFAAGVTHGRNA